MADNTLIPNTYQKPNMYSDVFDYYLTADESKTLDFFIRRILGFDEHRATRRDTISLSQIVEGIKKQDGTWVTRGTGQSRPAVVKALKTLLAFGFILRIGKAARIGQEYELVLDENKIDLAGLQARKDTAHAAGLKRTGRARLARLTDNNEESAVSQANQERLATHTDSGKTDIPLAVSLANTQNPVSKPSLKTQSQKIAADAAPPTAKEKNGRPSRPKAPAKQTVAKPKLDIIAPAADRDAMRPLVCRAVTGKSQDDTFWDVYGSEAGQFIKLWLKAGKTPAEFEAEYINPNGDWWLTWMAGDPTKAGRRGPTVQKRPTIRELKSTIGLLDNYRRNSNGHARAAPTSADTDTALRAAEERMAARRDASPFMTTDQSPAWAIIQETT